MLEDETIGPLYKTVLTRRPPTKFIDRVESSINGPSPLSVTKINQIISLYVTVLWVLLLYKALPPISFAANINWEYVGLIFLSLLTCAGFLRYGKTFDKSFVHVAKLRKTEI